MYQWTEGDREKLTPKERHLYYVGLSAFIRWQTYKGLFIVSLVGNVIQWWVSR